jgi:hypothetical protein
MMVMSRTRRVTAEAAASVTKGSNVDQARRSVTPTDEKGPASTRLAQSRSRLASMPGTSLGRLTPTCIRNLPGG